MARKTLTQTLSEPLDGASRVKVDIDTSRGNLMIDGSTGSEPVLAKGILEYAESQGLPSVSVTREDGQATLTLMASDAGIPWYRRPWSSLHGATEWDIHLNPWVQSDLTAHSGGGNVMINLAGMAVSRLSADSGGGNLDVVLPDQAANLSAIAKTGGGSVAVEIGKGTTGSNTVEAKSGAGNVMVTVPEGIAVRIHASSGMGKVIVDPRFEPVDGKTYESADYDLAANKVEITAMSGAGNVRISSK